MKIRDEVHELPPDRPSVLAVLESCSMLNCLDAEEKSDLVGQCFTAFADRGDTIWRIGDPATWFALVGTGFVKMCRVSPRGQQTTVELIGPGQVAGLMVSLESRPFPLSAVAATPCWYLKVPMTAFDPLFERNLRLKDALLLSLGPRLRKAHDLMSRLSGGRVEERIAAILLMLAGTYGERSAKAVTLAVPLTRQDISEMAGTTVETTIRILSKWQKEGLVRTDHQRLSILDEDKITLFLNE